MDKTKALIFVTVLLIAVTLSCIPALAVGLEWTKTTVYWYVIGVEEVRVTLVNQVGWTTTNTTGNLTTTQLNFTCPIKDCQWVNASIVAASEAKQDAATPAVKIENTGTVNAQINISVNVTWAATDCFKWRYSNSSMTVPAIGDPQNLNITNITLKQVMVPGDTALSVWLFGNFSNCQSQTNVTELYVWANF